MTDRITLFSSAPSPSHGLDKAATGVKGLDAILGGGVPRGRPTLVCGGAGCGKTLLAMEFLARGAREYGEPGVFFSLEEKPEELLVNVASLKLGVAELHAAGKLAFDFLDLSPNDLVATGAYDLTGLFLRLETAIERIGAKRLVLDTLEMLFGGLDEHILRAELQRLFGWLKERGVTALVTAERGDRALTRQGLEEYVSDCVILLDHRVTEEISTRRLRVVKYRGTLHGTNEYPFLIDEEGLSVLPVTSLKLEHRAPDERLSSGVRELDGMLEGKGFYRGGTVLVSGPAGSGKTSLGAHFVDAVCRRGETAIYYAFEESRDQLVRNMRSIGVDLAPWIDAGTLKILATRPVAYGIERHLVEIYRTLAEQRPSAVVLDPVTDLVGAGDSLQVKLMLTRLIDRLKTDGVTTFITSLVDAAQPSTGIDVSSLIDTWISLRDGAAPDRRERAIAVLKSRGMAHSDEVRGFRLTREGVRIDGRVRSHE